MGQYLHLFSLEYLLNPNLGPFTSRLAWVFLGIQIFIIFISFVISIWLGKSKDIFFKKFSKKFLAFAWVMGGTGIILWSFRQINAVYISAPILIVIWIVFLLIWAVILARYAFIVNPKRKKELLEENRKRQYIP